MSTTTNPNQAASWRDSYDVRRSVQAPEIILVTIAGHKFQLWDNELEHLRNLLNAAALVEPPRYKHGPDGKGPVTFLNPMSPRDFTPAAPVVAEGMPVSQEPKYGIRDNRLYNRASGEIIPSDEPVFIFRARDSHAVNLLANYARGVSNADHADAVWGRVEDFKRFWDANPERMKEPDTFLAAHPVAGSPAIDQITKERDEWKALARKTIAELSDAVGKMGSMVIERLGGEPMPASEIVGYVDPMSIINLKVGASTKEWLWAKAEAGNVPLYSAAPAAPTNAKPDDGRIAYQITGWGETDLPEVTFAETLDAAKDAVIAMVYNDPTGGKDQATDEKLLHGLDGEDDLPWEVKFEIGGVGVRKVFVHPANPAAQSVRDAAQPAPVPFGYVDRAQLDWLNRSTSDTASVNLWRARAPVDAVAVYLAAQPTTTPEGGA